MTDKKEKTEKVELEKGSTDKQIGEKITKSLDYSIKDGAWWSVMIGAGESYISPFAVFLNATAFQISVLTAVPQLISSLLQLFAVKITNIIHSRKTIVVASSLAQAIVWPLIVILCFWTKNIWVLTILVSLYFLFGLLASPAWSSWMGDLVPQEKRGKYFGYRNRVIGFTTFIAVILAGALLDNFSKINTFMAFTILFLISFASRLVSCYYLSKKFEPQVEIREPRGEGFFTFIKKINKTNFGIFTLFSMIMMFAVNISSPLFVLYWLHDLNMNYMQYMILVAVAQIATFITMTHWGAHADYYGNKTILIASSLIVSLHTFFWYFLSFVDNVYVFPLAIVLQILSGFGWAGFNLSSSNFIYDSVQPEERIRMISYHNALKGIAVFFGALLGGVMAGIAFTNPTLLKLFPKGILFVIIFSGIVRLIITLIFMERIKDVKVVEHKVRYLYFMTVMPAQGLVFDSVVGMNRTIKKFKNKLLKIENKLNYWEEDYKKKTKNE